MIHKIERIVSIGKFRDFNSVGDVTFNKLTLIYSDNGLGKTTLTSLLRSLVDNDVSIVQKRLATNSQVPQAAQIIQRVGTTNTFHTYRQTGWSNPFQNIEIFDIHFVNDNVYSGFNFDNAHGQNLHQFAIGAAGVQIRDQIEQNKSDKSTKRALIERVKDTIIQQVGFGLTESNLNALINLTEDSAANIDSRIATAQTNLSNAQSNQVIQSLQTLAPLSGMNVSVSFVDIVRDLQTTIEGIQEEALQQLFQNHCGQLSAAGIASPEAWLRLGHNFIQHRNENHQDAICPFCSQPVTGVDLLRSYAQIFNEVFRNFIRRLEGHRNSLQTFNLDAAIQRVNLTHNQNPTRIASWASYLPSGTVQPDLLFMPDSEDIREALNRLRESIELKISNPSVSVPTDSATGFQALIQSINNGINGYNQTVQEFNGAIEGFRSSIITVNQAQTELNRLSRIRQRFLPNVVTSITELITEQGNLQALDTAYPLLLDQQEASANAFFNQYSTSVNRYLRDIFRTPYQISNVQNIRPQGRGVQSRFGYTLTINGQPISFDHSVATNVKDCLSEGDKSTLALAFFLSKIDNDPHRVNKIIVLDDPLSSFDKNRRFQTISELLRLFRNSLQLVVLSHDGKFLYDLNRRVRRRSEKKGLRIFFDEPNATSVLQSFDIEKSLQNDYFICLDKITEFIQGGQDSGKREMRREIRIALEYHLIFKFYNQLGSIEGTFGNLIERLSGLFTSGSIQFRDNNGQSVLDDLTELNEISWDSHHGDGDLFETSTEIPIEQITLNEFKLYLQKTLDLINNRI
jgi:wobble nucleotide-excising tRNase